MANALKDLGNSAKAIEAYEKVLKFQSNYIPALSNTGVVLKDFGKRDEAISVYKKILNIESENVKAHLNISDLVKYRAGDPQISKVCKLIFSEI